MTLLNGKSAVITGANRGIGLAIMRTFAAEGADLWACARTENDEFTAEIRQLAAANNVEIIPIYFDFDNADAVKQAAKDIIAAKKPIDIIVNNAGIIDTASFMMTPMDKVRHMLEVNFVSQMAFTQPLVRTMARHKSGSIINISSSSAIEANEGRTGYAASKSAMITATRVMSRELGQINIRVNAIAPGLTETDMMRGSTPDDILDATLGRVSLRRVAEPSEIANVALFLASDMSSYMTGQTLSVDGGM